MLEDVALNGHENIVSWQPHGKAFRVHKPHEFAKTIMPCYFHQTKYKSFQRQLHIYGFKRINQQGMLDTGAYYHEQFIRGDKDLCLKMTRKKIKGNAGVYACKLDHPADPNFYATAAAEEAPSTKASGYSNRKADGLLPPRPITPSSNTELQVGSDSLSSILNQYKAEINRSKATTLEWVEDARQHIPAPPRQVKPRGSKIMGYEDSMFEPYPLTGFSSELGTTGIGNEMFFEGKRFYLLDRFAEMQSRRRSLQAFRRLSMGARQA